MSRLALVVLVLAACGKGVTASPPRDAQVSAPVVFAPPTIYPAVDDAAVPAPDAHVETRAEKRARLAAEAKEAREQAAEERRAAREQAAADKVAAREQAAADRAAAKEDAARERAEAKEGAEWIERETMRLAIRQSAPAQFRQWAAQANVAVDFSTRGPYEMILVLHGETCNEDSLSVFAREASALLTTAGFLSVECAGGPSIKLAH